MQTLVNSFPMFDCWSGGMFLSVLSIWNLPCFNLWTLPLVLPSGIYVQRIWLHHHLVGIGRQLWSPLVPFLLQVKWAQCPQPLFAGHVSSCLYSSTLNYFTFLIISSALVSWKLGFLINCLIVTRCRPVLFFHNLPWSLFFFSEPFG